MQKKQIALLRAINVSGKNKIIMEDLRILCKQLEFENVLTYIQSGNIVFTSSNTIQINQELLKKQIKISFGLDIEVIVFYKDKLEQIYKNNSFLKKNYNEKFLYYCFLFEVPEKEILESIKIKATLSEEFVLVDDILYLYYPMGMGKSKITNRLIESKFKIFSTIRNHNTLLKLKDLCNK